MKKVFVAALVVLAVVCLGALSFGEEKGKGKGEELFKKHCAACHPDGKNVQKPGKSLYKKDMEANKIKTADDIVKLMRKPGPGMIALDEKTISEKDAKEIAEYILKTFK